MFVLDTLLVYDVLSVFQFYLDFSPDSTVIASRQTELEIAYRETAALSDEHKDKLQVCIL